MLLLLWLFEGELNTDLISSPVEMNKEGEFYEYLCFSTYADRINGLLVEIASISSKQTLHELPPDNDNENIP